MARTGANVFIHPLAQVDPETVIGEGTRIWQFAVVLKGARIGKHCNIGSHCYIESGVRIGNNVTVKNGVALWNGVHLADGVFVGPYAVFTNDLYPRSRRLPEAEHRYRDMRRILGKTRLKYAATIGGGAMILSGITIGEFASVGLGAVACRSIPPYALVVGNPARQISWVCECGVPLSSGAKPSCKECGKQYRIARGRLKRTS
ncbi:MAG TPA: DapH/DapD/GlmU-related protein [Acidobacteriota bacterium]|nr:DapH/DapD/GlmU-related protein [Acidobacteriota bacterium]